MQNLKGLNHANVSHHLHRVKTLRILPSREELNRKSQNEYCDPKVVLVWSLHQPRKENIQYQTINRWLTSNVNMTFSRLFNYNNWIYNNKPIRKSEWLVELYHLDILLLYLKEFLNLFHVFLFLFSLLVWETTLR